MAIVLSKSEYMMFLKHPAWLWLKKYNKSKLPLIDDNQQAIFDAGNLFESHAKQLFPDILDLGFNSYDEYLSLPERTKSAISSGAKAISQGRFEVSNITCICDLLIKVDENVFDLYEIKSSTKAKTEHEVDLAFQVFVLESCGYQIRTVSVIHVNNAYARSGAIDVSKLASTTEITKKVFARIEQTKANIALAMQILSSSTIPDISPANASGEALSDWLDIYKGLATIVTGSIYELNGIEPELIGKLESLDIKLINDIPDDIPLTEKQKLQVLASKLDKEIIQKEKITDFISNLKYPLYFLDYETLSSVVPYFDGYFPYQQIPFQYSLHILDKPDGELKHASYLHKDKSSPARQISESLKSNIGDDGTVLVWYENFEKKCNLVLGELTPEHKPFFEDLNKRIVDLMTPFSKNWYVHKDFQGSASIKKVLPVLVPVLTYSDLDIHEGASAQRLWMEAVLDSKRENEKEKIFDDLEKYCKLDTLAMVEIYKILANI